MADEERREYEASIKNYWDYYSTMKTALEKGAAIGREEGRAEGRNEANLANARKMKELGADITFISQVTGLTAEEIEGL